MQVRAALESLACEHDELHVQLRNTVDELRHDLLWHHSMLAAQHPIVQFHIALLRSLGEHASNLVTWPLKDMDLKVLLLMC